MHEKESILLSYSHFENLPSRILGCITPRLFCSSTPQQDEGQTEKSYIEARLQGANLNGVDLENANLKRADLS